MDAVPLPPRTIVADRGDAGRRLDLTVRRHLVDLRRATRTRVQRWVEDGRVSINGRTVARVASRVALNDVITVQLPDEQPKAPVVAEEGPLERLFEDDHFLIVSKAAGLVSHPTFRHPAGSLLNIVWWHARAWSDGQRPSLVGRLDKLTSGAIAIAKTPAAHARLQRVLTSAFSEKTYLAIVYGDVAVERGAVTLRLRRDPADRRRVIAADDGLDCLTRFRRIDRADLHGCPVTLLRCDLVTGRMHQIRVHLAASGWPLIADAKYGQPRWSAIADESTRERLRNFPRQALHAWRLAFTHPFTGERIAIEAPLPADFSGLLATCGLRV